MALDVIYIACGIYCFLLSAYIAWESSLESIVHGCVVVFICEFIKYLLQRRALKSFSALIILPVILTVSTLTFFVIAILLGAPLLSECEETLLLSLLVSLLAVLPLALCAEGNPTRLRQLVFELRGDCEREQSQLLLSVGGVLGAWLGACVIPLDWDRPWQVWPVSCCVGALSGVSVACIILIIIGSSRLSPPSWLSRINPSHRD